MKREQSVGSARWIFAVNKLAASPFIGMVRRKRILRRYGLEVEADSLEPGCYFHSADIYIGPGAYVNYGVHIENVARVEVGARTGLGVHTIILTSDHELGGHEQRIGAWSYRPVKIGEGCWIGARVLILGGVTIGDGCVVAAGSVVTADCEPDGLYAGVPARRVRDL